MSAAAAIPTSFKYVYIPADVAEPVQQLELAIPPGKDVECLMDHLKAHFRNNGPRTPAMVEAQKQALLAQLGDRAKDVDARMLDMVGDMQMVENISLLAGHRDVGHVSVNMYCDDMAQAKELPLNPRACGITEACGRAVQVKGDAFIARLFDDDDNFRRLDFMLPELSSSAEWVKAARRQAEKRGDDTAGRAFLQGVQQQQGQAGSGGGKPAQQQAPKPQSQSPGEGAKEAGNAAAKKGDWAAAADAYQAALAADPTLLAAANNLALALLKLGRTEEAEAAADKVLAGEPRNVKALLRRAAAREARGNAAGAAADYSTALQVEPKNAEASAGIARLAPPPPPLPIAAADGSGPVQGAAGQGAGAASGGSQQGEQQPRAGGAGHGTEAGSSAAGSQSGGPEPMST